MIMNNLFWYFAEIFTITENRRIEDQKAINAGLLTRTEIEIWLSDKCLNDTYLYDENKDKLIPIGNKLESIKDDHEEKQEKIMHFVDYLSTEEILLIQKIGIKLRTYDITMQGKCIIGKHIYYPVDPTIRYMANNFYQLYQCFIQLRSLILKFELIDMNNYNYLYPDIAELKIRDLYAQSNYMECLKLITVLNKKKDKPVSLDIQMLCEYKLGNENIAHEMLREILKSNKLALVYIRGYISDILYDPEIRNICREERSQSELLECINTVILEQSLRKSFETRNSELKKYYEEKVKL